MRTDQAFPVDAPQGLLQLAFLLLFPGFFLYHSALGLGYMSAFAGGFFTPATLLLVLPLLFAYRAQLVRSGGPGWAELAFFGFLAYVGANVLIQVGAGANSTITRSDLLFLLHAVVVFIIFRLLDVGAVSFQRRTRAALLLMSLIVFSFSENGVFYLGALGRASDPDAVATYQGFSRSYLFVYLVLVAHEQRRWVRFGLYALAGTTLYLNGARSEFVAMLSSIPVIELYRARQRGRALLALCALAVLVKGGLDYATAYLPENRTLELLDLSQSTSATLRYELTDEALATIARHPIQGSYASYSPGSYAHNVLSAWVDLGLFGFLWLVGLMLWPLQRLFIQCFLARTEHAGAFLPLCLCCTAVLLLLGSHHYHDMLIAATLGSYANYISCSRADADRASQLSPSAL